VPETWRKLERLRESCCDTKMWSTLTAPKALQWTVVITHRKQNAPPITAQAAELQEAVRAAVSEAQVRGWVSDCGRRPRPQLGWLPPHAPARRRVFLI
jgi:hypothetical protein